MSDQPDNSVYDGITPATLRGPGRTIYQSIMRAMQDAEEIWGCSDYPDYAALMDAIAQECQARKLNAYRLLRARRR